jgi:hypothetical protein
MAILLIHAALAEGCIWAVAGAATATMAFVGMICLMD